MAKQMIEAKRSFGEDLPLEIVLTRGVSMGWDPASTIVERWGVLGRIQQASFLSALNASPFLFADMFLDPRLYTIGQ